MQRHLAVRARRARTSNDRPILHRVLVAAALALLLATPTAAQDLPELLIPQTVSPTVPFAAGLDARLDDYQVVDLPLAAVDRQIGAGSLHLRLWGRDYLLHLAPLPIYADRYQAVLMDQHGRPQAIERPEILTLGGTVDGETVSTVRLTRHPFGLGGYLRTADQWLFLDPLAIFHREQPAARVAVYRARDLRPLPDTFCGSATPSLGTRAFGTADFDRGEGLAGRGSFRRIEMGTDADGELFDDIGAGGILSHTASVLNAVDGIYDKDLNVSVEIVFQLMWSNPNSDPYTLTEGVRRLEQFRNYWNANISARRDNAYFFTGADIWARRANGTMNFDLIGRAEDIGTICRVPNRSYQIGERLLVLGSEIVLAAHEIGHSFNAVHDNQPAGNPRCPNVACNDFGPIMCTPLQAPNNCFSECSIDDIGAHVGAHGGCLVPPPPPPPPCTPTGMSCNWDDQCCSLTCVLGTCGL